MQLPFIHIHTYIFNHLSFAHLTNICINASKELETGNSRKKKVETPGKLLYNKNSKDKYIQIKL